jgi:type IV secretion system protein VirB5
MRLDENTPIGRLLAPFAGKGARNSAGDQAAANVDADVLAGGDGAGSGDYETSPAGARSVGEGGHNGNPFLSQRHEFHNRFYDLAKAKRNWQLIAFASVALLAVVTVSYVVMASSSRITPYVVEVSELGIARAYGPAERLPGSEMERVITAELSEFIMNTRRVLADPQAQREAILEAYAFADKRAETFLNNFYSQPENDPRLLALKIRRTIHIESILRIPDSDSYRVRWTERERGQNSTTTVRTSWEAILAVATSPPETEETLLINPLGVYVYDINWGSINQIQE